MVEIKEQKGISSGLRNGIVDKHKTGEVQEQIATNHNNRFPVFRISQEGRIIYANRASFPVLKSWNCYANNVIPKPILNKFPALTNLAADETIELKLESQKFLLSVVGFQDAGYIGVYGFKTEIITDQHSNN